MGRWIPDPSRPVNNNEAVGRRLFDEPKLAGATDQKKPEWALELTHFEDTRGDVSLDRLGQTGCDKKVVRVLRPLAENAGRTLHKKAKRFDGWATVRARELIAARRGQKFPIVASPVRPQEPTHPEHNPYHAHVTTTLDAYVTAMHLRQIFQDHGEVLPSGNGRKRSVWRRMVTMLYGFTQFARR